MARFVQIDINDVRASIDRDGYYASGVNLPPGDEAKFVLDVARSLGEVYTPPGCEPERPIIRTIPTRDRSAPPFDRPESIGWHGDFASHADRPELSIVYITRPDPRGGNAGAWRLASVWRVIDALIATPDGRDAYRLLTEERLPFSYADGEQPTWFPVVQLQPNGHFGLRLYLPSLRRGCQSTYGTVPPDISNALALLERAADDVGTIVPTVAGSYLVVSNWFALHDRIEQTVSRSSPNREALLCFIARIQPCTVKRRS